MHAIAISSAFVPAPIVGSRPLRPCNAPPTSTGTAGSQRRTGRSARAARLSVQAFRGVEQKVATVPVTFTMKHKAGWQAGRWLAGVDLSCRRRRHPFECGRLPCRALAAIFSCLPFWEFEAL